MFKKILVANRGEVALRVMRTAREMGIKTVAVYSQADVNSRHVEEADEAICIGPAPSNQSYLVIPNIIQAALQTGAEAIHPGYGFLAENSDFSKACTENGIKFIGPSPDAIDRMGNKSVARETATAAGVPVVPGSPGAIETVDEARAFAHEVGYPVLVKASAGGGGKGMRIATSDDDLQKQWDAARTEALAAFGDDTVYLEKYLLRPRHIEIQILVDQNGEGVYLYERDCSVQRRHQKLIEEAPSVALSPEQRIQMGEAALQLAASVDYEGAGTVECLFDQDGSFYFMEMNTRIQVEHCVTEMIVDRDIVREQISIAYGNPLSFKQEDIGIRGHAIEFRINAEDPRKNFQPSPGRITRFAIPGGYGVRCDSYLEVGKDVPPFYDSLVAKLLVWGATREEAIARGKRALKEFHVEGIATTIDFHYAALDRPVFETGEVYTDFLEKEMGDWDVE